jgi:hypothetical protein
MKNREATAIRGDRTSDIFIPNVRQITENQPDTPSRRRCVVGGQKGIGVFKLSAPVVW